jgi:hypothetical protein
MDSDFEWWHVVGFIIFWFIGLLILPHPRDKYDNFYGTKKRKQKKNKDRW